MPTVWIGKKGLNKSQIDEVDKQLKIRKLIKVKLLKSVKGREDRKRIAEEITKKTSSELIDAVGGVIVLKYNKKE